MLPLDQLVQICICDIVFPQNLLQDITILLGGSVSCVSFAGHSSMPSNLISACLWMRIFVSDSSKNGIPSGLEAQCSCCSLLHAHLLYQQLASPAHIDFLLDLPILLACQTFSAHFANELSNSTSGSPLMKFSCSSH